LEIITVFFARLTALITAMILLIGCGESSHRNESMNSPIIGTSKSLAPVPKTGQTTSYAPGDDGAIQPGVSYPTLRFTDNGNGTITDHATGLIWLKNANPFGSKSWIEALSLCANLASGQAGLTDGSTAGQWRLPNRKELMSLMDFGQFKPALPVKHPFQNVQLGNYWSSTSYAGQAARAWYVDIKSGFSGTNGKIGGKFPYYIWPVRQEN
jgi:hypothetical protein